MLLTADRAIVTLRVFKTKQCVERFNGIKKKKPYESFFNYKTNIIF